MLRRELLIRHHIWHIGVINPNQFFLKERESMSETPGDSAQQFLQLCIANSRSRQEFWVEFIRGAQVRRMLEVGVYQGDFAEFVLQRCEGIVRYYMLDPWRHLPDWNKPANLDDPMFERFFVMAKAKTDLAGNRRVILRGKTTSLIRYRIRNWISPISMAITRCGESPLI